MLLSKAEICARIPHAGSMCLLESVVFWDATQIRCLACNHRDVDNPLRRGGRLRAICGVEYAAQAMALHGALTGAAGERPRAGYLASLREVSCRVAFLDQVADDLHIEAETLITESARVIYRFALYGEERELLCGRAAVVLDL